MQDRDKLVLEFWDRGKGLSIKNSEYNQFVDSLIGILLKQDINKGGITTGLSIKRKQITAVIVAKEEGIIAGLEEFSLINKSLKLKHIKKDGDKVKSGDILIEIKGDAKKILERERISLNLLQRMSGIATLVKRINRKLKNKIRLAATRKTLWGLIDKKAVSIGGGLTHRLNLNDGVIIKDNYIRIMNNKIEDLLKSAADRSKYVEVEAEDKAQAFNAAKSIMKIINNKRPKKKHLFAIMLDKIPPEETKSIINKFKKQGLYNGILIEVSGNIREANLSSYLGCDADIISMGSITNSSKILDMSLEIR